jgi:ribosome-associated protein
LARTRLAAAKTAAAAAAGAVSKAPRKSAAVAASAAVSAADGLPKRKRVVKTLAQVETLRAAVLAALEEMKARDVVALDVREKTSITDWFIIVGGTSSRHVKSLADEVVKAAKALNLPPLGVEGEGEGEWVVVDLGDIVVHVMQPRAREFYALEKLWGVGGDPWLEPPTD